jgi:signal peptidase II
VVSDQLLKQWIVANYEPCRPAEPCRPSQVVGDWLRIDFIHNAGGLFGLFQGTAPVFALVTIVVVGIIVAMELRWGWRSPLMTLALGLLLGGAIGNFIDRIRLGYVVDFVDIGIGTLRWYIFNIADAAVTCFFLLLIVMWIFAPKTLSIIGDGEGGGDEGKGVSQAGAGIEAATGEGGTQGPVAG